jgi:ankyrin repeat protein
MHAIGQTLSEALDKNDTVLAANIIKNGYDVNSVDKDGSSALLNACRFVGTDTSIICFLLRHGAKPDYPQSAKGRTALIVVCAYYGGVAVCRVLINAGARVNATAGDGATALMKAAGNNKADVVEYLLSAGAKATLKDSYGKTALNYATASNLDADIIKMLTCCRVNKQQTINLLTKATQQ